MLDVRVAQIVKSDFLAPGSLQIIWSRRSMELGGSGISEFFGDGNSHRERAVFRYSRNTSTTASGSTNSRMDALFLGTLNCSFRLTS